MLTHEEMRTRAVSAAAFVEDMITEYEECVRDYPQYAGDRETSIIESVAECDSDGGVIVLEEHEHVRILFGYEFQGTSMVVKPSLDEGGWQPMNECLTKNQTRALNEYVKHVLGLWHGRGAERARELGLS